jgi:hypothetical protein
VEDLIMKIAPGIHRIGDNSMINAYLIEQVGEVTIIDAGVSGFYKDIDRELAAMGRTPADVRALVLTHGHTDHIGFAERLRRVRRVPVSVHEADAALARGEVPNPAKGYGPVKPGPLLGFFWFSALHGGLRTRKLVRARLSHRRRGSALICHMPPSACAMLQAFAQRRQAHRTTSSARLKRPQRRPRSPSITAALRAFSSAFRVAQRDAGMAAWTF